MVNLLTASSKGESRPSVKVAVAAPSFGKQFLLCDQEIGKPFATAIAKIDRRLLCINTMRPGFSNANERFLN
jgi:hypothetical protein